MNTEPSTMNQLAQGLKIPGSSTGLVAPSGLADAVKPGQNSFVNILTQTAFDWIGIIAVLLATLYVMWSGIQFITSQGDPSRLQDARRRLMFAILGLIIVFMAFLIVRFVIGALGGNPENYLNPTNNLQPAPTGQ